MKARKIIDGVLWMGSVDWDRRLFDSLIPLPEGTTYNSYLVRGSRATALIDAVDPAKRHELMEQLDDVERLDYLICLHAEQDHSGAIPDVLARYPEAKVLCSKKCAPMLWDLLRVPSERITVVEDDEVLDLGDRTLRFIYAPWVHWPETMLAYLAEDRILFTCDFLGAHLAASELFSDGGPRELAAAKRYYAEIMMPFASTIVRHLDKIEALDIETVCPSHGPVWTNPSAIIQCYRQWTSGPTANRVCLPFVTMHGSTLLLVDRLVDALVQRGVGVDRFELTSVDLGLLAMSLIDCATVVIAAPTVLGGIHPAAAYAAFVANALRPRTRFVSAVTSYGWAGRAIDQLTSMLGNLSAQVLDPVVVKGLPGPDDYKAIDDLAERIAAAHREAGIA
ncbi:MAG: FprA family A-type flavoprotein [Bacillota bacterium]|jgi:flavorubredoxin|nr:FprA family A-type flavoprotein [Bacillota bacterium]